MKSFVEYLSRIQCLLVIIENVQYVKVLRVNSEMITIEFRDLSSDGIPQEVQETNLILPGNYSITHDENVNFQPYKGNSFQLRMKVMLEIDKDHQANKTRGSTDGFYDGIPEKWRRKDLSKYDIFSFNCQNCKQRIIDKSGYKRLNDMPSAYWEELMDYWHCHKPHIDDNNTQNIYSTKYNHSLRPTSSELLLGGSYILCLPELENRPDHPVCIDNGLVKCSKCQYELGNHTKDNLIKLNKWNLILKTNLIENTFDPIDEILMSLMIFSVEQSGRHMLVHHGTEKILLWLFNTGLNVTIDNGYSWKDAMKVMYTKEEKVIADIMKMHNVDEITTQKLPYTRCISELQSINDKLPSALQSFGDWHVSYTELYNHRV